MIEFPLDVKRALINMLWPEVVTQIEMQDILLLYLTIIT